MYIHIVNVIMDVKPKVRRYCDFSFHSSGSMSISICKRGRMLCSMVCCRGDTYNLSCCARALHIDVFVHSLFSANVFSSHSFVFPAEQCCMAHITSLSMTLGNSGCAVSGTSTRKHLGPTPICLPSVWMYAVLALNYFEPSRLQRGLVRGGVPLVTCGIAELVAIGSSEIVKNSGTTRSIWVFHWHDLFLLVKIV